MTHPRTAAMALVMSAVLVAPLSSASAHRYHGGPFFWPFAAAAAVSRRRRRDRYCTVRRNRRAAGLLLSLAALVLPAAGLLSAAAGLLRAGILLRALIKAGRVLRCSNVFKWCREASRLATIASTDYDEAH